VEEPLQPQRCLGRHGPDHTACVMGRWLCRGVWHLRAAQELCVCVSCFDVHLHPQPRRQRLARQDALADICSKGQSVHAHRYNRKGSSIMKLLTRTRARPAPATDTRARIAAASPQAAAALLAARRPQAVPFRTRHAAATPDGWLRTKSRCRWQRQRPLPRQRWWRPQAPKASSAPSVAPIPLDSL